MEQCTHCAAPTDIQDVTCPSCGEFLGYPNVRVANNAQEAEALNKRWDDARSKAIANGLGETFDAVTQIDWRLVVAVPYHVALSITTDPKNMYINYEKLVGAGARSHATFENDTHRKVVSGALFGSFGEEIVYGVLSLGQRGLETYGKIFCLLKNKSVKKRTTFLECNSYEFVEKYGSTLPPGYRSNWKNRGKLAAIKLMEMNALNTEQSEEDWDTLLLQTDARNRQKDQYIEGHLFKGFNIHSIEAMIPSAGAENQHSKAILEAL